jgi:hypothetical protein
MCITKSIPISVLLSGFLVIFANISPSFAQSTDRDNPTPLTTNILSAKAGEVEKIYYYQLNSRSGKIKITLDVEVNSSSGSTTIKVQNPNGETLDDMTAIATGGNPERKVKTIELPTGTPTILEISTFGSYPRYRIKVEGDWTQLASTDKPYGADTCKQGYVWREATPSDRVCVTPQVRAQTAEDNRRAAERRVP